MLRAIAAISCAMVGFDTVRMSFDIGPIPVAFELPWWLNLIGGLAFLFIGVHILVRGTESR